MTLIFESTVEEIFNKFDVQQTGVLTYPQFKAFYLTVGKDCTPEDFEGILSSYTSTLFAKPKTSKSAGSNQR